MTLNLYSPIGRRNEDLIIKKDKKHLLNCPQCDCGDEKSHSKITQPTVTFISCPYYQNQSNSSNYSEKDYISKTVPYPIESNKKSTPLNDNYDIISCPNYAKYASMKKSSNNYFNVTNTICSNALDNDQTYSQYEQSRLDDIKPLSDQTLYHDYLNVSKTICTNIINERYEKPTSERDNSYSQYRKQATMGTRKNVQSIQVGGETRNQSVGTTNGEFSSKGIQLSRTNIGEVRISYDLL